MFNSEQDATNFVETRCAQLRKETGNLTWEADAFRNFQDKCWDLTFSVVVSSEAGDDVKSYHFRFDYHDTVKNKMLRTKIYEQVLVSYLNQKV